MREVKEPEQRQTFGDRLGGVIDNLVYAFAPIAGGKRMQFRRLFRKAQLSAHEGAGNSVTRGSSWIGSRLSPEAAMEEDLADLRSRSIELYRNDSIGGAVDSRVNLVVSYGFTPHAAIQPLFGLTQAQCDTWNNELELLYDQLYPLIGSTGKDNLWQCLRLVERHLAVYGESFTVLSSVGMADKPIPLSIEVIDPERVETPMDKIGNPRIRMGVEYDVQGRVVAYYIRRTHPGDMKNVNFQYDRIEASRVLHLYEKWFAGQSRGYPWLARTLNRIKDGKDLGEATIIAAQVEACFAVFIEGANPYGTAVANAAGTTATGQRYQEIAPGGIHYVQPGEKVNFASPSKPGNTFGPFMEWNDRKQAAGMNYPYEMLGKNWGGLSFAAGRLVLAEAKQFVKSQQRLLIEQWLTPIWNRMVEEAYIVGEVSIPRDVYASVPLWAFKAHEWGPPAWPFALTPREEIESAILAVENNFRTKQSVVSEYGNWIDVVFMQRAKERQLERDLGIIPEQGKSEAQAAAQQAMDPQNAEQELQAEAAA